MGTKVKPVQSTEIRDIKIAQEAIAQIRKKPSAAALRRHKKVDEMVEKMIRK